MWVWLVISLIILAACIIFALRVFSSNYGLGSFTDNYFSRKRGLKSYPNNQDEKIISDLRVKLQAIEDSSMLYMSQLNKLQLRLDSLEKKNVGNNEDRKSYDDDNWEDLYYKIRDEKEKLDEEYSAIKETLEEKELTLQELEKEQAILIEKKSVLEAELEEAYSLQNKLGELKRKLDGAVEREKELQQQLERTSEITQEHKMLQKQYAQLKMETDELRNRVQEMDKRDALLQQKVNRLNELESNIEMSEYEKSQLIKSVQDIIVENETLAAKLQQLQGKLSAEKFA